MGQGGAVGLGQFEFGDVVHIISASIKQSQALGKENSKHNEKASEHKNESILAKS